MIFGVWDPAVCMAIVKVCKGTHLDTMGVRGRIDTLFPEEMLFLVEKSRMSLFLSPFPSNDPDIPSTASPASVEECYALLLQSGVTLEEYLVYAHLKSLGNILFRRGVIAHSTSAIGQSVETKPLSISGFEVWTPKANFSRKSCPSPSFLLLIDTPRSNEGDSHFFLKRSLEVAKEVQVPLKLASVENGVIDFFNHSLTISPL